ncbi:TOMM precursor leader peptide-binding protein [Sporichthya brevicatena]|uniref:TOMM leader peptide-binding protein n=1 Tax=Sporichthya brevicatena TaxID=171442 RepID=A0ABN1H303_9ACTN
MPAPTPLRRPKLKTGLVRLRRGPATVQFGLDPDRAVLVSGLDAALDDFLDRLDGTVRPADLARRLRIPAARVRRLLAELAAADLLEDAAATADGWDRLPVTSRDRLAPDLAAATLAHPGPDAGKRALSRRLAAAVQIRGGGRVGATAAALLAAAGVGHVHVVDDAVTTPADLAPGGLRLAELGQPRGAAATTVAGEFAALPWAPAAPPALVILADRLPGLGDADDLVRAGTPHLVAALRETEGVVGPLVLPFRSSCLHCHHLTRTDRDRAWPHLAAQLAVAGLTAEPRPADVVLATLVAAQAALEALSYLDTGHADTVDGTLHLRLPDGARRRRSWRRHPACGCAWAERSAG